MDFFFHSRNFNQNIADILVNVTTDTLGVNLFIYKRNGDTVQVLKCSEGLVCKPSYIKFTHNNLHPQENHHEAILKDKSPASLKRLSLNNLELLSDVTSSKPTVKKAKVEKPEDQRNHYKRLLHRKKFLNLLTCLRPQHLWISLWICL